jgi:hypothetical protein
MHALNCFVLNIVLLYVQEREYLDFQFLAVLRLLNSHDHHGLDRDPGIKNSSSNLLTATRRFFASVKGMSLPFQLELLTGHITTAMNLLLPLVFLTPPTL